MKTSLSKILIYIFIMILPLTIKATTLIIPTPPPAPTIAILASGNSCNAYAKQIKNYLKQFSSFEDVMNAGWFTMFSRVNTINTYSQRCVNGNCTNYYGVNENNYPITTGCAIAATKAQAAKQSLLDYLMQAYQAAMVHQSVSLKVGRANSFGLYGPANSCIADNQHAGCQLLH